MLASATGRDKVLRELLNLKADVSVVDHWDRSPLLHACTNAFLTAATYLIAANAPKNDGSLHEASKNLDIDIATLLVSKGHDPEHPSLHHKGRSALGELCVNASSISSPDERTRLRKLMRLLIDNGSSANLQIRGKSVVFLALDNGIDPLMVTKALLDTEAYRALNDPEHIYKDKGSGLCYSAISYVEHGMYSTSPQKKCELIQLLEDKRCQPCYYSEMDIQPDDAIGMPEAQKRRFDFEVEHKLRQRLDDEAADRALQREQAGHAQRIRQKRELEAEALQLQHTKHAVSIQQERELGQERRSEISQTYAQQAQLEQGAHTLKLQRLEETKDVQLRADQDRHNLLLTQDRNQAVQRRQIMDNQNAADLEHGNKIILQQQAALDARINAEHKALLGREKIDQRMLNSRMENMRESERIASRIASRSQQNTILGLPEPD